ncbi:hypothetical protein ACFYVL_40425 [Streptomyces sp. NPDC004111]|uniref:hypothetical protein n=1 Tax=Streptomyces sp. NPDC004111 TaxID=3364690 RepID=UPI0036757F57
MTTPETTSAAGLTALDEQLRAHPECLSPAWLNGVVDTLRAAFDHYRQEIKTGEIPDGLKARFAAVTDRHDRLIDAYHEAVSDDARLVHARTLIQHLGILIAVRTAQDALLAQDAA